MTREDFVVDVFLIIFVSFILLSATILGWEMLNKRALPNPFNPDANKDPDISGMSYENGEFRR